VRPFNGRERQMESRLVVDMAGETQVSLLPAVADTPGAGSLAG